MKGRQRRTFVAGQRHRIDASVSDMHDLFDSGLVRLSEPNRVRRRLQSPQLISRNARIDEGVAGKLALAPLAFEVASLRDSHRMHDEREAGVSAKLDQGPSEIGGGDR